MTYSFDEEEATRNAEARLFNAYRRLKTDLPVCFYSGLTNAHGIQDHHIAGRRYCALTIPLSSYCHDLETNQMKDWPKTLPGEPDQIEITGRLLLGLARFAECAAPFIRQCAEWVRYILPDVCEVLLKFATALDANHAPMREKGLLALRHAVEAATG
jgi:hypothetical protein